MGRSSTSDDGDPTEALVALLKDAGVVASSTDLEEIARQLLDGIRGRDLCSQTLASPLRRLAELTNGDLSVLTRLSTRLVDVVERLSTIDQDREHLSGLLVELSTAFCHHHQSSAADDSRRKTPISWDQAHLQRLIDALGDPIFVKDEAHRWVMLNNAYCEFIGYPRDDLLGKSDFDFFDPEEAEIFWEKDDLVLATGETDENEERFTDADGEEHVIITKKTRFRDREGRKFIVGIIRDITERKRLESRIAVARRLMSLGTLASGIAHEINNPLTYVLTNLEYVIDELDARRNPDLRDALESALHGGQRVRDIVEGLSTFSGAETSRFRPVDVRDCLASTVQLVRHEITERAELVEDYQPVPLIEGDERSLNQIVLNLLMNAFEALAGPDDESHQIRVATSAGPDGDAVIEISDTGIGIPESDRDHIFDPFFTTKPVGEGTGLGLSICHNLVEAMDGRIDVESQPGQGTTFRIAFPAAGESPDGDASPK